MKNSIIVRIIYIIEKNILLTPMGDGKIRIVTHLDFSDQMLEKLLYELKGF